MDDVAGQMGHATQTTDARPASDHQLDVTSLQRFRHTLSLHDLDGTTGLLKPDSRTGTYLRTRRNAVVDQPFWKPAGCADIRIQQSSWTAAVVVGIVGLARDHIGKFKTVGGVSTVVMENGMPAGDERLQLIKKRCASG